MGVAFWVRRFFVVLVGAFVLITGVQLLKGHARDAALVHGLIWAPLTAAVFVTGRLYQSRRGQHCAVCQDTPEMQQAHQDPLA